jgi:hypothetical protein
MYIYIYIFILENTSPLYYKFKLVNILKVYGSVHRKYIPIYIQQNATLHILFISGNCSICFGWYLHPSSGGVGSINSSTMAVGSSSGVTNTRCCRYSCTRHNDGWSYHPKYVEQFPLLYTGLIPVESVSWMLLSSGAKLEPQSGLGGEGCLL